MARTRSAPKRRSVRATRRCGSGSVSPNWTAIAPVIVRMVALPVVDPVVSLVVGVVTVVASYAYVTNVSFDTPHP